MNKIHKMSLLTTVPELELYTVPPTQVAAEQNFQIDYRPIATLTSTSVKFHIKMPEDHYIFFHESYFFLKCRFSIENLERDGTSVAPVKTETWDNFNVSNYLLHSMIKSVEITIGHEQLFKAPHLYSYRAYIEALLGYSEEAKKTSLKAALWTDTDDERRNSIKPLDDSVDKQVGRQIELMGRLHTDLTHQNKALIGGCDIEVEIEFNKPEFYMQYDASKLVPHVEFIDSHLEIAGIRVSPAIRHAHSKALAIGPAKYPIVRGDIKTFEILSVIRNHIEDHVITGQLPRRLFIMLVNHDAFNGSIKHDPFNFQHFKLNHLVCYVNGVQYPTKPYQPDFQRCLTAREYIGFLRTLNQNSTDATLSLTMNEFNNGNTIFGFNFSPDLSNGFSSIGHASLINSGVLRIQFGFEDTLTNPISVVVFSEFDSIIEIDQYRKPRIEF